MRSVGSGWGFGRRKRVAIGDNKKKVPYHVPDRAAAMGREPLKVADQAEVGELSEDAAPCDTILGDCFLLERFRRLFACNAEFR